jgi:DNA-binding GntR family transcriptional regulator
VRSTGHRSAIRSDLDQAREHLAAVLTSTAIDPDQSYAAQIHARLRDSIVRGRLPPGAALSEAAIAEAVGTSRTPVREALQHLVREQLVDIYPQVGTRVAPLRIALIGEGCFVRRSLECANLLDLVGTITPAQRRELRSVLSQHTAALRRGDSEEMFRLDEALHRRMFECAGRPRVWSLIQGTKLHLDRVRWLLLDRVPRHAERILNEHRDIYERLVRKDRSGMSAEMQRHIEAVAGHLAELRGGLPANWFED